MKSDSLEGKIQQSLEGLRGELDPCKRDEAVVAMTSAQPKSAHPWARRAALAAVAAVVLVGLGFVPIPLGRTKGMLDRAMAAAESARTVHITTRFWPTDGKPVQEMQQWLSEDGFWRIEGREDGQWVPSSIVDGGWETIFITDNGSVKSASSYYDPRSLHPAPLPDRAKFMRTFDLMRWRADRHGYQLSDLQFREYRSRSLWGGEVAVVEATMVVSVDQAKWSAGKYQEGDQLLFRAEIDPDTEALLSQREYRVKNGSSQLKCETTYEWNVEITDDLRHFEMPAGTKLERSSWWETRADKVLAQGSTSGWQVTLHAIDAAQNGDLALSISRVVTPEEKPHIFNSAPVVRVEAVGAGGEEYTQDHGFGCMCSPSVGYWNTTLHPKDPSRQPNTITLTIWPYDDDPCKDQSVTLRDIPLPPRQDADNVDQLYERTKQVIQY